MCQRESLAAARDCGHRSTDPRLASGCQRLVHGAGGSAGVPRWHSPGKEHLMTSKALFDLIPNVAIGFMFGMAIFGTIDLMVTVSTHRSEEHTSELQSLRHLVC